MPNILEQFRGISCMTRLRGPASCHTVSRYAAGRRNGKSSWRAARSISTASRNARRTCLKFRNRSAGDRFRRATALSSVDGTNTTHGRWRTGLGRRLLEHLRLWSASLLVRTTGGAREESESMTGAFVTGPLAAIIGLAGGGYLIWNTLEDAARAGSVALAVVAGLIAVAIGLTYALSPGTELREDFAQGAARLRDRGSLSGSGDRGPGQERPHRLPATRWHRHAGSGVEAGQDPPGRRVRHRSRLV